MVRFIATADWQLGMTASFLPREARPRFAQARIDAIRAIGALARARDAAFVLVCGDVFESNQLDRQVISRAFDALREIDVPVFLLPGNHDPLDASSLYTSAAFTDRCPEHVHVLDRPGAVPAVPGVEIVAAPWFTKQPVTDLVAAAMHGLEPPGDVVRIVAGHGIVDSLNPDRDRAEAIAVAPLVEALHGGVVDMVVLGDRHSTTEVADRIWYPGASEVTRRVEVDPGQALVVDVDHAGATVEPVRVGAWRFTVVDQELAGEADIEELRAKLEATGAKDRAAIWLRLSGMLSVRDKARLDAMLEQQADLFALLTVWDRHHDLTVLGDTDDFGDFGLTGFARDAVDELAGLARGNADEAATAQDALGLLYGLVGSDVGEHR